jgi:hypothetical protein
MARKVIRTDKPFEAEGRWWVPGKGQKKVPGKLEFDPKNGGTLRLSGSLTFKDQDDVFEKTLASGLPQYEALFGTTIDGTPITLFDNWIQKPSHLVEGFFVNRALVGYHSKNRTDLTFKSMRMRLFNLERWFEHYAFDRADFSDKQEFKVRLKESSTTTITGKLPSLNATFEVVRGFSRSLSPHKGNCKYQSEFVIKFARLRSLDECCVISSQIQNLFSVLIGGPTSVYDFQVMKGESKATFLAAWRQNVRLKEIWNPLMPCNFQSVGESIATIIDEWIKLHQKYGLVITLLFEVLKTRGAVLEDKFFNLVQAIEGYCRTSDPFTFQPRQVFRKTRAALVRAIPPETATDFAERIKSSIDFANSPSLRGYMERLFQAIDGKLKKIILGDWTEAEFIKYVKDMRNNIAHTKSGSEWSSTKTGKLRDVMARIKHLLIVLLLEMAGVPLKVLQDNYKDVNRWTWG